MEQAQPVQQQTLPPDVEAILQPQAPLFDPLAEPAPGADPVQAQPQVAPVAPPAPVPAVQPAPVAEPQVPLHVLIEERKERQAYQAQIRQLIEDQRRASQPQPEPIDPDANPGDAARFLARENAQLRQTMQEQAVHQRANTSEMIAREKFGDTAVDAAVAAAKQQGLGDVFLGKQRPYQELMGWHNSQTIAQQVGPDLKAWETKKEAEIEARVLARLQQAGAVPARPGVPQVLPPSLSTAARAATAPVIQDTSDFFKGMFAKPQRP